MGSSRQILRYLGAMTEQLARIAHKACGWPYLDQAVHNYLLWSSRIAGQTVENGTGPVLTMAMPSERVAYDRLGRVVRTDGSVIPILHQYDRIPEFRYGQCSPAS